MGEKQAGPSSVMVAFLLLLLFTAATPTAYGLPPLGPGPVIISGNPLGLVINGRVCCSSSGNCNGTTPALPGVGFNVICTKLFGVSVVVAQGFTSVNGIINISIPNILPVIGNIGVGSVLNGGIIPYAVTISLPLPNRTVCPLLSAVNGTLVGVPVPVFSLVLNLLKASVQLFFFVKLR